ncbi:MAG: helix-turn-helix domain-containing protein [Promethearchaeota archaeon]
MAMKNYKQFKTKLLRDKEIKQAYENLGPEFALVEIIIKRRIKNGLTQRELAQKIGTKQSAISRLESGMYNPSISFLQKIAEALDVRIKISLAEK